MYMYCILMAEYWGVGIVGFKVSKHGGQNIGVSE